MLHRVALCEFVYKQKNGENRWESQTGPALAVECILQGKVVSKDIFKIFIVEMQISYLL
jgi:hypothetical protein